jgi:hypothetical protein
VLAGVRWPTNSAGIIGRKKLLPQPNGLQHHEGLKGLPPQRRFVAVEALKYAAIEIRETQEAIGQFSPWARKSVGTIFGMMLVVRARLAIAHSHLDLIGGEEMAGRRA